MLSKKLISILSEVFNLKESEINISLTKDAISSWDSLKQMDLVTTLEEKFDITLEIQDILKINSVKTICEILKDKGINNED